MFAVTLVFYGLQKLWLTYPLGLEHSSQAQHLFCSSKSPTVWLKRENKQVGKSPLVVLVITILQPTPIIRGLVFGWAQICKFLVIIHTHSSHLKFEWGYQSSRWVEVCLKFQVELKKKKLIKAPCI